jgi:hypothetical protein
MKKETLEEAAEKYEKIRIAYNENYINSNNIQDLRESHYYRGRRDECIKWQQERSYRDDEVKKLMFDFYYDMSHKMNVP